jgi:hypothetical protein
MWLKINESLWCHIKNFKTTDIFPTQCWDEWLNFEWVDDWYDIETKSCLFEYEWDGTAIVKNWVGNWWTKGIYINPNSSNKSGSLKYRVFTYVPTKFNFDIKTNLSSSSYVKFYINGIEYLNTAWNIFNYNAWYEQYSTPLLAPVLYDFKCKVYQNYSNNSDLWLDNLSFTCKWGGW